jgi:uncharacterized membrane protein
VAIFFQALLTSVLLFAFGVYWRYYPPKKINNLYGYRTRRSMANQTVWDYANKVGAQMLFSLGWISFILTLVVFSIVLKYIVIVNMALVLAGLGIGIYWCETKINKKFDKNGNSKKEN